MCTVTWYARDEGYSLWVNRDERRGRARAESPSCQALGGVRVLLPRDPEGGGTWTSVNEGGLGLSLLNDHTAFPPEPASGWVSRGQLVLALAGLPTPDSVGARLSKLSLGDYRPFQLLVLSGYGEAFYWGWNGSRLTSCRPEPPLSSSGYDSSGALSARQELLTAQLAARGGVWTSVLPSFHRSHEPDRGALSPCMHRAEATTVSLTVIEVSAEGVSMAYADGPPCRTELGPPVRLAPLVSVAAEASARPDTEG